MTDRYISSLMSNMGWGTGFRLPIANAENKRLEQLLDKAHKKNLHLRIAVDEDNKRVENMQNELQSLSVVLSKNTKIAESEKTSFQHERNLSILRSKHLSHLKSECKKFVKHLEEHQGRKMQYEKELNKRTKLVERISSSFKYDEETLRLLKESGKEKEKEVEFIAAFVDMDKKEAEALEIKIKNQMQESITLQNELHNATVHTHIVKQQYERLVGQFRRVHKERNEAVKQWKDVIESLKHRDETIKKIAEEYVELRGKLSMKNYKIDEKRTLLEELANNLLGIELTIEKMNRSVQDKRDRISEKKLIVENYSNSSTSYKVSIDQSTGAAKGLFNSLNSIRDKLSMMAQTEERAAYELKVLKEYYDAIKSDATSTDDKIKTMLDMIDNEEELGSKRQKELEKSRQLYWEALNSLANTKKQVEATNYTIKCRKFQFQGVKNQCKTGEMVVEKRRQDYYRLELRLISLERKLNKFLLPEERTDQSEDFDEKTIMILKLKQELFHTINQKRFLLNQKNHLWEIVQKCNMDINGSLLEKKDLDSLLKSTMINTRNFESNKKLIIQKMQDLKVQHSICSFEKSKLTKGIKEHQQEIFTLEHYRSNLKMDARIRIEYIKSHQKLLFLKKRNLMDGNSKLIMAVNEVLSAIKRWKIKYGYHVGSNQQEEGSESEAYMILKHAQEKEIIKKEGYIWDKRVKEAEKEVLGLQNTLSLMITSNESFRESLGPALKGTKESDLLLHLQKIQRQSIIRKKKAEQNLSLMTQHYFSKEEKFQDIKNWINELENVLADRRFQLSSTMLDVANQKNKIQRANIISRRLMRKLDGRSDMEKRIIEADLKSRCTREKYEFAIKTLGRTMVLNPNLRQPIFELLKEFGIFSKLIKYLENVISTTGISESSFKKSEVQFSFLEPISPDIQTLHRKEKSLVVSRPASSMTQTPSTSSKHRNIYTATSFDTLAEKVETSRMITKQIQSKRKSEHTKQVVVLKEALLSKKRPGSKKELKPTIQGQTITELKHDIIMKTKVPAPMSKRKL